jgi:hypothetical protein
MTKISDNDPDRKKGATETDEHSHDGNAALTEQLPHRNPHPIAEGLDSDFPEPGENPEHSGEPESTSRKSAKNH